MKLTRSFSRRVVPPIDSKSVFSRDLKAGTGTMVGRNQLLVVFHAVLLCSWVCVQMANCVPVSEGRSNATKSLRCSSEINSCRDKNRCTTRLQTELGEAPPRCYCDMRCSALNDCCWDYESSCDVRNHTKKLHAAITTHHAVQAKNWKCCHYSRSPRSPGIWMISSCPAGSTDNYTRLKCEEAANVPVMSRTADLHDNVPTTHCYGSECVTFRNRFCARCNSVLIPIFWKITWRCNIRPPTYLTDDEQTQFLLENCPDYNVKPQRAVKRRYCYPVVSNCSVMSDIKTNKQCVQGAVALVYSANSDKHYKNPSCLQCNEGKVSDATCGPTEFSTPVFQPKSFEMVLQFGSFPWERDVKAVKQIRSSCGKNHMYDPFLEECRVGVLPDPLHSIVDVFRFKAWIKPLISSPSFKTLPEDKLIDVLQIALTVPSQALTMISVKKDEKSLAVTFDVKAISINKSAINSTSSNLGIKVLLHFKSPFNITIDGALWSVFKITHRRLACSNPIIYPPSNFTQNGSQVILDNKTIYNLSDVYILTRNHSKLGIQAGSLFVCRSFFAVACEHRQVLLALESKDYVLQNDSLLFIAASKRYGPGEFQLDGSRAWVCTASYKNVISDEETPSEWGNKRVLWYFTVCGMSMSIVCLFFLLATYFTFKELRTMPGKNLMSLSISLILCHFTWLLGSGDTDNTVFCKTIAIVLHYFFLVSFACTTVIAYDTRRAFPKNSADMSNILFPSPSKKRFLAYLSFSWGVPLVFVVTCVVIDQQGKVTIGYGNAIICWLTDMKAQILFFGVPIGMMLLYNLVAFVFTVQAIRAAKLGSNQLHRQGATQSHEIKIYFRLMTLMGFTWFFGFGAHALHKYLMYPFVVLTSLHGVYLAFAFTFKPYVFNLYRNRFANISMQSRKSTISTIDLTTSMKSNPSKETESVL